MLRSIRWVTMACVVAFSGSASADPITFRFTGPVTFNETFGFNATSVSGSYTFDSDTPLGSDGQWTVTGPPYGFSLLFDNGFRYQSETVVIATNNDLFGSFDEYIARSVAVGPDEVSPSILAAVSVAGGPFLLPNADLPLVPPTLIGASRNIWVFFTGQGAVAGPMTSFTVDPRTPNPIPEPATMMLVGGGLSLLGIARARTRRRPSNS